MFIPILWFRSFPFLCLLPFCSISLTTFYLINWDTSASALLNVSFRLCFPQCSMIVIIILISVHLYFGQFWNVAAICPYLFFKIVYCHPYFSVNDPWTHIWLKFWWIQSAREWKLRGDNVKSRFQHEAEPKSSNKVFLNQIS